MDYVKMYRSKKYRIRNETMVGVTVDQERDYRKEIEDILFSIEDIKSDEKEHLRSLMSDLSVEEAALVLKNVVVEAKKRQGEQTAMQAKPS